MLSRILRKIAMYLDWPYLPKSKCVGTVDGERFRREMAEDHNIRSYDALKREVEERRKFKPRIRKISDGAGSFIYDCEMFTPGLSITKVVWPLLNGFGQTPKKAFDAWFNRVYAATIKLAATVSIEVNGTVTPAMACNIIQGDYINKMARPVKFVDASVYGIITLTIGFSGEKDYKISFRHDEWTQIVRKKNIPAWWPK